MVKSLRSWVTEIPTDFETRCREKKAFQLRGAFSRCLPTGRARIPRGPAFPALNGATLGRRRRRNGGGHLVIFGHFAIGRWLATLGGYTDLQGKVLATAGLGWLGWLGWFIESLRL